jgi:hypothetical protein
MHSAGQYCHHCNFEGQILKIITSLTVAGFLAMSAFSLANAANRHVDIVNDTGMTMAEA